MDISPSSEGFDRREALSFALVLANACLVGQEPSDPVRRAREALEALAEVFRPVGVMVG